MLEQDLTGITLGQYQIKELIGKGGMAYVFKAWQANLKRFVAVKVLMPWLAEEAGFAERFQQEAEVVAQLHHPHILEIYDYGSQERYHYLAMRYVEKSQTLNDLIKAGASLGNLINYLGQIADALNYAHEQGIIHRDVKPSNILIDRKWALLSDFGLVKIRERSKSLTGSGYGIGTPAYMSPEQITGSNVDHRTDIYALGVILHQLLTGTVPHDDPSPLQILIKRKTEPLIPPRHLKPDIPESLEQVVLRSLAPNPQERYSSTAEFITALKKAEADPTYREPSLVTLPTYPDESTLQSPPPITGPAQPGSTQPILPPARASISSRKPARWLVGVVTGLILLGCLIYFLWSPVKKNIPDSSGEAVAGMVIPTQTIPAQPSATPTPPPLTPTATPRPPTPSLTPTVTPHPPTFTPTAKPPTATSTFTATPRLPTATATPTLTPTRSIATPTTVPAPSATITLSTPTITPTVPGIAFLQRDQFILLRPLPEDPCYVDQPIPFKWQWDGPIDPERQGFEVRVWREGEPPVGAHNAVSDNQSGLVKKQGQNQYDLEINISGAAGVNGRSGNYLWTVLLVEITPAYKELGIQADPGRLCFATSGGKDSGGGDGGAGGGGSGGHINP